MTISKYIVDFLNKVGGISIDTNHVKDGADQYGLFKSPSRDKKDFTDDSYEVTEYYQFLARLDSVSDEERKEADELLEDLTYKLDDYKYEYDYPEIDKGRRVTDISVTGCPYPMETGESGALYDMSLSITYLREREDF